MEGEKEKTEINNDSGYSSDSERPRYGGRGMRRKNFEGINTKFLK
jgi:hypothetical protein